MLPKRRFQLLTIGLFALCVIIAVLLYALLCDCWEYARLAPFSAAAMAMGVLSAMAIVLAFIVLRKMIIPRQSVQGVPSQLPPAPSGYTQEYSAKHRFAFSYPSHWNFQKRRETGLYAEIREPQPAAGMQACRNFNISCHDISGVKKTKELFAEIVKGGLGACEGGQLALKEPFAQGALCGIRYRVDYQIEPGRGMCCYQFGITSSKSRLLLIVTFTLLRDDFERSREFFDTVIRSIVIL